MRGVSESATVNNIIVAIKLTVVIAFIVIGVRFVNTANWHPLVPAEIPAPPPGTPMDLPHQILRALGDVFMGTGHSKYGVGGVITGAARIFFAYLGFEAVSTAGAEARNPARDMPIGIIGALVICTALYIATSAVLVGIVPYAQLDTPAPIAVAVNRMGMPWFSFLVKIGAIAGLSSVMLVLLYGQTRIFYTMSRDGLLPSVMSVIHKRFKTPWINTIVVGVMACGAGGVLPGLYYGDLSACLQSRPCAPVPCSPFPLGADPRGGDVPVSAQVDPQQAADRSVLPDLCGHRVCALFRLRDLELQTRQGHRHRRA